MNARFSTRWISGIFLLVCLFVVPLNVRAEKVKHVVDGDTLVLDGNQRVRLIGIDAPEIDHPEYHRFGEFWGEEARLFLRNLVEAKEIRLEGEREPLDAYGRRLAYVFLDGLLVNRELVRLGHAEVFRKFDFRYREEFYTLEAQARNAALGMWNKKARENFYGIRHSGYGFWHFSAGALAVAAAVLVSWIRLKFRRT